LETYILWGLLQWLTIGWLGRLSRGNDDLGVTDTLPSVCASSKATVHCICACDTQVWHFAFVTLLPTGRSWVIKKFSSWSQSKTSWPPMK